MNNHKPILNALNNAGHEAYFVGGCVRDHLLGRESKDIDICTSATPDEVAAIFPESKLVGAHFGVVIVRMGDLEAEVATFRTDGCYGDGRRPDSVKFTKSLEDDIVRRDFTVNALASDGDTTYGSSLGRIDLEDKLIRCVGDPYERFQEDALRMLRAIRFAAQLGFSIEHWTEAAIFSNSPRIQRVSAERVQIELNKILTSGHAAKGTLQLHHLGLLEFTIPEVGALQHQDQNPNFHPEGNVFVHTLHLLEQLPAGCSLTLALAALMHDIGKPATAGRKDGQPTFYGHEEAGAKIAEDILRRLKYPNDVIETVVSHVAQHMTFRYSQSMRKAKLLRFVRQDNFLELLELHRMDATAGSGNLANYEHCLKVLNETPPEIMRPTRLVTGDDLIEFGLRPGPEFRTLLEHLENLQLEGLITDRQQAREVLGSEVRRMKKEEVNV